MHPLINEYYKTIKAVVECFIIYLRDSCMYIYDYEQEVA